MRILDQATNRSLSSVTVYLTMSEAGELRDRLKAMVADPIKHQHEHVVSSDGSKEVIVCVYDAGNLAQFDERSRKLIERDI
jgi:hypothetical protein